MQKTKGRKRGCAGCGGVASQVILPPKGCPCPCGWVTRPRDCDRVFTECRWEGLPVEECIRRREECRREWEDWPFYRGPCPRGSAQCQRFCTCVPVTAAHALLTVENELAIEAERPVGFRGPFVETECVRRARPGAHVEVGGTYLVTVHLNLPQVPAGRFYVTLNGDEVTPGGIIFDQPRVEKGEAGETGQAETPRAVDDTGVRASFQALVTAGADSMIGLTSDTDVNMTGEDLLVTMLVMRIA